MDYAEIKQSLEEREEAIRRHNEHRKNELSDLGERIRRRTRWPLESKLEHQRRQILRALDALHRGNYDDAKRILEAM